LVSSVRISADRALHKWFLIIATIYQDLQYKKRYRTIFNFTIKDWFLVIQFSKSCIRRLWTKKRHRDDAMLPILFIISFYILSSKLPIKKLLHIFGGKRKFSFRQVIYFWY